MSRSYGQYCGLARALDVVGDRWNLLIIRQLLVAPARYRQLAEGLPGIATNLLTDRLRDLEAADVIERRLTNNDGHVVYALTQWGADLRGPIEGLVRWSTPLMIRGPEGDQFRSEWLLIALPALFAGRVPARWPATIGLAVDGRVIQIHALQTGIELTPHDGRALDAIISTDAHVALGLAVGMLNLDQVRAMVNIEGDEAIVRDILAAVEPSANAQ
ncbi:helix-turn-helix transcriptional regulator [Mycobacterium sp. MYCO198283]|uniref:winged helix-turn-helix transcriptional regulator n=1 Tax=Mycobacterium sp. MYCO198283 TaxID=2883505 RepID=UPI001E5A97A4|nr:helix-turn-helix domain-containing protein [Mycobacterium sp. MYCO198283]MCG5430965.1 helix-turn-helix transcriptional regulator [Mycobacterium sp. MYCO198283]